MKQTASRIGFTNIEGNYMDTDNASSLHATLCEIIADALTSAESGGNPNVAIDIRGRGVTVEHFYDTPQATKQHFAFGVAPASEVAQAADAPRELALGNMVQIRHGDRFLPNPGKIISMTTSLVTAPDYLVEYWLNGEPISKWFAAGYVVFFAEDADAAEQRDIVDDAAAALRHEVRLKAKAPRPTSDKPTSKEAGFAARNASFNDEGPFLTPLANGECIGGATFVDEVAAAARKHGMIGSVSVHFSAPDEPNAEDIARP